jgi:hypothetical protein
MIVEPCSSTTIRPRPTVALPERGPFRFPEPYGTTGIRLTNASDGPILPCGYSYWSNINAHMSEDHLLVFLGVDRQAGGAGPSLWRVDKATHAVLPLGPIFPDTHPLSWSTAEGWYWSATDPHMLYACDLEHLYRVDVITREIVPVIDITPYHALGKVLWQFHTSADDCTHSATVKDASTYQPQGCVVYREGVANPWSVYAAKGGGYDECQIDKSGEWLLIKENLDGQDGEDNRMIRVADGCERVLMDRDGAAGHSDNGYGYMVAADNWNEEPNALRLWMLDGSEPQGRLVYHSSTWEVELNHVSHGNARPGAPDHQWVLGSGATRNVGPRANELVMFRLDGELAVGIIAPTMVDLDAGEGSDYDKMPKANVDASGMYALWTANPEGRRDAFLVQVPAWPSPPDPAHTVHECRICGVHWSGA